MTGLQLTRRQYYALCTMVLLSPLLHLVPRKTTAEAGCGGWLCALAALVPLLLFAYCYGVGPGMVLGALYGVMQFLLDGMAWAALGAIPNLLDYPIAFGLLGLAGCFRGSKAKMTAGFVLGCFGRFMASFLSGFIFYGQYAPEGVNPVWYSLTYNGSYMLVECIICIALGLLVGERLAKELKKVA